MKNETHRETIFSEMGLQLCANAIQIGAGGFPPNVQFEPDSSKAYLEFNISNSFPVVTAYGTALHPGTVANSWQSMLHQVFNLNHRMKSYDRSKEKNEIPRDNILGAIVGVELVLADGHQAGTPSTWRIGEQNLIRGVAVIHKNAEQVPKVLGEHLGGRHKWTVSMEVDYQIIDSGFMITQTDLLSKPARSLVDETTPEEFKQKGLGYVDIESAPEALLATYDFERKSMKPRATWGGSPVVLLKGGPNGKVHYRGVGLVRYGAEREAEVAQILATDPSKLTEVEGLEEGVASAVDYFRGTLRSATEAMESLKVLADGHPVLADGHP